jgi:hypothetical protein
MSGTGRNVLLMTTTVPVMGRTIDDGRKKPALYKLYDYTMGKEFFAFKASELELGC